jgi:hypothetical protein
MRGSGQHETNGYKPGVNPPPEVEDPPPLDEGFPSQYLIRGIDVRVNRAGEATTAVASQDLWFAQELELSRAADNASRKEELFQTALENFRNASREWERHTQRQEELQQKLSEAMDTRRRCDEEFDRAPEPKPSEELRRMEARVLEKDALRDLEKGLTRLTQLTLERETYKDEACMRAAHFEAAQIRLLDLRASRNKDIREPKRAGLLLTDQQAFDKLRQQRRGWEKELLGVELTARPSSVPEEVSSLKRRAVTAGGVGPLDLLSERGECFPIEVDSSDETQLRIVMSYKWPTPLAVFPLQIPFGRMALPVCRTERSNPLTDLRKVPSEVTELVEAQGRSQRRIGPIAISNCGERAFVDRSTEPTDNNSCDIRWAEKNSNFFKKVQIIGERGIIPSGKILSLKLLGGGVGVFSLEQGDPPADSCVIWKVTGLDQKHPVFVRVAGGGQMTGGINATFDPLALKLRGSRVLRASADEVAFTSFAGGSRTLSIWSVTDDRPAERRFIWPEWCGKINPSQVTLDGDHLIILGSSGQVVEVDLNTGQQTLLADIKELLNITPEDCSKITLIAGGCLVFHSDGVLYFVEKVRQDCA